MKANATEPASPRVVDTADLDDYYGSGGNNGMWVWFLRMAVRVGSLVPVVAIGLPALARATAALVLAFSLGFGVAFPFMVTLAVMTWRRLAHPAPALRFEPRGDPTMSASTPLGKHEASETDTRAAEQEEQKQQERVGGGVAAAVDGDAAVIRRVAVIGGGAAGLATLRQMLDKGMDAVLFESSADVGGLWVGLPTSALAESAAAHLVTRGREHSGERENLTTKTFVAKKRHHKYSLLTAAVISPVIAYTPLTCMVSFTTPHFTPDPWPTP